MRYIEPITDRSATDVTNKTAKAFLNVADWLRIYQNQQVVKAFVDFILSMNITFSPFAVPTITSVPNITMLNTLLENIENIRQAEGLPIIEGIDEAINHDWGEGAGADAPDYLDVNQWEYILDAIYNSIGTVLDYRVYAGVCNAGQPRFYQARWHTFAWVQDAVSPVRRARAGVAKANGTLTWNNGFRRYE